MTVKKIKYVQTKNMTYKDMRVNIIKFLNIDGNYYINYELIFFNILQIVQPNYKEFAIIYFHFCSEKNAIFFNEKVV